MLWKAINSNVTRSLQSRLTKAYAKVSDSISKAHSREKEEEFSIKSYSWALELALVLLIWVSSSNKSINIYFHPSNNILWTEVYDTSE